MNHMNIVSKKIIGYVINIILNILLLKEKDIYFITYTIDK